MAHDGRGNERGGSLRVVGQGQICSATSRLLVHSSRRDELLQRLATATSAIRLGDPLDRATQMGAVISHDAANNILAAVAAAQADGATLLCGGSVPPSAPESAPSLPGSVPAALAGGCYVEPTVLVDVPTRSSAWREEIFGPVLCVASFDDEADAITLANDSAYGLAHAVMSSDTARCERVAAQLDAGTVWLNCNNVLWPQTQFGGWKASGFGKEWGAAGLQEYLRHKTITATARPGFSWGHYG